MKEQYDFQYKIFEAVNLTLHGHYTHVIKMCNVVCIHTENRIFLPKNAWMIKNTYGCQMHSMHAYYC